MDIGALQQRMREAFRVEATDLLAELDSSMLELESRPQDADLLNRVFRAIHTLKGSGATAGFMEMAAFTHHVEELFDEARLGQLTITPEMIDLSLQAKDLIGQLMESDNPVLLESACAGVVKALARFLPHRAKATSGDGAERVDGAPLRQRHRIFFRPNPEVFFSGTDPANLVEEMGALGEARVTAKVDGLPPLEELNPERCYLAWEVELLSLQPTSKIKEVFLFVEDESEIRIESQPAATVDERELADGLAAFLNIAGQSVEALGGFLTQLRDDPDTDSACRRNYLRILRSFHAAACHQGQQAHGVVLEEQIQLLEDALARGGPLSDKAKGRLLEGVQKLGLLVESLREGRSPAPASQTLVAEPSNVARLPSTPAVDGTKKDALRPPATIRVDQEKLDRLMRAAGELLVARNAFPILAKKLVLEHSLSGMGKEVKDAGDHISHIAEDLQAAVLSIRMMPIRTVFQRFPRMVRDICRAQEKEAELLLEGEDTELDKTVIEQMADPLVHLVRNAVDHGIELPAVRVQAGKPRTGKVTLRAYNKENNVVIEICDDGRGMDPVRLKQKAVEKGLITPAAAKAMDDRAALDLIFLPGLSTAEKVTDISGRGVGMDVVRSNLRQLHGTTTLESQMGKGSRITITLPASLMVSKGILVESEGEEYVFPIESVIEMVHLPRQRLHRHEGTHYASIRDRVYPVLRLGDHFASEPRSQAQAISWPEEVAIAIVQTDRDRVGVALDRFVSYVEVIVKPLGRDFANISAFQGATIMGDGRVALVINPSGFV